MSRQRITLHVGRIVVDGPCRSRVALAAAVEAELARVLAQPGALGPVRHGWAAEGIDGGHVRPAGPGDAALGRAVARATAGALRR